MLMQPTETHYKLFCDESCHLENQADIMVLGAICCPERETENINRLIKKLRYEHHYKTEIKWTKLHSKQQAFYEALITFFLENDALSFKASVVLNKKRLKHTPFSEHSHNNFYYKMFYYTLRDFLNINNHYKIYIDYMDTQGRDKMTNLTTLLEKEKQVMCQPYIIRSYESQIMQLCDLFIGALSYSNRHDIEHKSPIKNALVDFLQEKIGYSLKAGTPPWEEKFAIFQYAPSEK